MGRTRRREVKTRRPKEIDAAIGITVIWLSIAFFFVVGGGLEGRSNPLPVIVLGVVTVLVWWLAIAVVRRQTAAGKTLEELQALSPEVFEEWVAARFRDLGYKVKLSGAQGDHGVDLLAERPGEIAVVQCKRYNAWSVGEPILRDLFGAMHDFGAQRAFLVTTGRLTAAASKWVEGKPIEVWDGEYLVKLSQKPVTSREEEQAEATEAPAAPAESQTCPKCGSEMVVRRNRRNNERFLGCSQYPKCHHTQPLPA